MLVRLLLLLAFTPMSLGQVGIYGAPTGHRERDPAPDLGFSQVLSAPETRSWTQTNLTGKTTVLSFFPDTSHNPRSVANWNARVEQYAGKGVQFVWITGEEKASLMPALAQHPIRGWVLYDASGETAKAYGLDEPVNVYIGPDRKIIGLNKDLFLLSKRSTPCWMDVSRI